MSALTASPHEILRRALVGLDEAFVLEAVDSLQLTGAKLAANIAVPLRSLQKSHDVATFAASAPLAAVAGLLELLSMDALEKIVELLGEHAENPTYEQLAAAVAGLREAGADRNHVLAVLAFAAGSEFPAAAPCRTLLDEEGDLALPDLEVTAGQRSLLSPKEQSAEVLEQRRQRREEEKARKKAQATKKIGGPAKYEKKKSAAPTVQAAPKVSTPVREIARRSVMLTPAEAAVYSEVHPLTGWVVTVDVPFDAVDPAQPDVQSKVRPALVVAGSDQGLLVRGIYSGEGPGRGVFGAWRRTGLDHVSYLEAGRHAVANEDVVKLVKLTDEEWNATF
jgi:hypothetical protein